MTHHQRHRSHHRRGGDNRRTTPEHRAERLTIVGAAVRGLLTGAAEAVLRWLLDGA
jgi:hypothetical protein